MSIELKNLTYTYMPGTPFEAKAVDDISVSIKNGEFLGIIGHTGSGKTTLIGLMAGLLKPTSGTVLINGEDIGKKGYDRKNLRRHIGVVFQYPEHQLFEETVYKDIAFGPGKIGVPGDETEKRVRHAMALMELDFDGIKELSPFELSGGQKRRVAIAGVLAMEPEVLILDEPVAGLDPKGRRHLMQLITRLNSEGKTIIMITHSMDDLAENAQRVVVLNGAKMVMDDVPCKVFSNEQVLRDIGLDLPYVAKIAAGLRSKGKTVPQSVIRLDDLEDCVTKMMGKSND
ncbi:MAG: energy-coupling factor transporter ATPase [Eubacteriales bacterium]|nr:energy-coupling factor transporter ATPase [Eubacteriales bacterium]